MKNFIKKLALKAGGIILSGYKKKQRMRYKDALKNIVTETDIQAEKALLALIHDRYPDHNIFSEEIGQIEKKSIYTWIIDPLDGTANFVQNIPFFCTSIAFAKYNEIQECAVYDPIHKEFYYAKKNSGATLNNAKITVSAVDRLQNAICGFGFGKVRAALSGFHAIASRARKSRILGATGLALSYVARGNLDCYIVNHISSWDIAAGFLLVEEAGGKTSDVYGQKIVFDKKKKYIIASNKKIYPALMNTLKK